MAQYKNDIQNLPRPHKPQEAAGADYTVAWPLKGK